MTNECAHEDFHANVNVVRLTDDAGVVIGFTAEVRIDCLGCGPFEFTGLPIGMLPTEPTASVDGQEGRFPVQPADAEAFVQRWTGYSIRRVS
jgi:hypothetical protein